MFGSGLSFPMVEIADSLLVLSTRCSFSDVDRFG